MSRASCAGQAPNKRLTPDEPDPWFPARGESANVGKIICFTCPVRPECADYRDRTNSAHGMWAGVIAKKEKDDE